MKHRRKLIVDILINIVSYGLPIAVLQFVILPHLAKHLGTDNYGLLLTITGVFAVVSEMTCGTLANIRILENDKYAKNNSIGVFKTLYYILLGLSTTVIFFIVRYLYQIALVDSGYLVLYYVLLAVRAYYLAGFRINNQYSAVMLNNIIFCAGFIVGILVFRFVAIWQIVYIIPLSLACIHLLFATDFNKQHAQTGSALFTLVKQDVSFMISYFVSGGMAYIDRILLYPLLGAEAVSVYYVATLMGKLFNMLCAPINMVMLSYIAKMDKLKTKTIILIIGLASLIGLLYTGVAIVAAPYIIRLIYPQYIDMALQYIALVTFALVTFSIATAFRVISMKIVSHHTILFVELVYTVIYISLAFLLFGAYGLQGFCYAIFTAALVRFVLFAATAVFGYYFPKRFQKAE